MNMHQITLGLGKHMVRFGNKKGEQILRDAAEGVVGAGDSEPSNNRVLFARFLRLAEAESAYCFYGKKVFYHGQYCDAGSFGQDNTGESPLSVFAYLTSDKETFIVKDDWDTMACARRTGALASGIFAQNSKSSQSRSWTKLSIQWYSVSSRTSKFYWRQRTVSGNVRLNGVEQKKRHSVLNDVPYSNDKNIR